MNISDLNFVFYSKATQKSKTEKPADRRKKKLN